MPTIQPTKQQINKIIDFYEPYKKEKTPDFAVLAASYNNTTITVYSSGKVLFQGKNTDEELTRWGVSKTVSPKQPEVHDLPKDFDKLSVIGSDEVGNGSYFGSLTVCAAYVSADNIEVLKSLGVKDSKMLTDQKIRELAISLKAMIPYTLFDITPNQYNELIDTQGFNAVSLKVWYHTAAINELARNVNQQLIDAILIDQFVQKKTFFNYTEQNNRLLLNKSMDQHKNIYFKTKGEQYHMAVAAASIIARAAFLDGLDQLTNKMQNAQLFEEAPSGSGDTPNLVAAKIIKTFGENELNNYVKLHFANTNKAKTIATTI